ncbi:hypothetical protein CVO76_13425 [Arthrobacter agilis]|uniref:Uncharacterized protein n=1 Tax=Arthrobacter agilis TaxID=37921 RepID=A0A2L0UGZ7_9MICC|nr:hypothetical protein CVO76_13425 [Arthrobacter agilis]
MKLNSEAQDVKDLECPSWCVSRHDDVEDPEPCWSEDRTIDLYVDLGEQPPFEDAPALHAYVEQTGPRSGRRIMIDSDEPASLTDHQAQQLIRNLEHLLFVMEAE